MTGPDHYKAAEQLLAEAHDAPTDHADRLLAEAHVHASLAQTAALIDHAQATGPAQARNPILGQWSSATRDPRT